MAKQWVHTYVCDLLGNEADDERKEIISADTEDEAYQQLESVPLSKRPKGYVFLSLEPKRGRGGARPGAGVKKGTPSPKRKFDEATKVVRVPVSMDVTETALKLQELQRLVQLWQEKTEGADDKTRVRYSKAAELLKEVQFLLGDSND